MPMNLKQMIQNKINEVAQPLSQGEQNFKDMHKAINHKNLVPGITDQEHVFTGSTEPYDNKYLHSYKPGEDVDAYDKTLRASDDVNKMGHQTAHVEEEVVDEAIGSMVGKTHKQIQKTASFGHSNIADLQRKEKQRKAAVNSETHRNSSLASRASAGQPVRQPVHAEENEIEETTYSAKAARAGKDIGEPGKNFEKIAKHAAEKYGSKEAGKKVAGAILAKLRKEEVEQTDEGLMKAAAKTVYHTAAVPVKTAGRTVAGAYKVVSGAVKDIKDASKSIKKAYAEEFYSLSEQMLDEAAWAEKNIPAGNYNKGGHTEKGDLHHIEVNPEVLKKHGISHQVVHAGEYGQTHHFEHPSHGKVSVYQSDLNTKTGNPIVSVRTFGAPGAKPVAHKFAKKLAGKTVHVYNESVNENYDDTAEEISMTKTELTAIAHKAGKLVDLIPPDKHIEPWVQSKVARAKEEIDGVFDYLMFSEDGINPRYNNEPAEPVIAAMPMPSMSNPFMTREETDLDEKLSPEKLKKFAKLAPPYDKITHADKIVAIKKKETGQKVLPEASMKCAKCEEGHYKDVKGKMCCDECGYEPKSMKESVIKSNAMSMAKQSLHRLKIKGHSGDHTKMKTPREHIKMGD